MEPIESFRCRREVSSSPSVSQSGTYVPFPCFTLMLRSFRHDDVVESFTNQVLRVFSRTAFNSCVPRKLNEHIAGAFRVRTSDTLVLPETLVDDQVVPNNPELLLCQVVRRPYYPDGLVRSEKVLRGHIPTRHRALTEPSPATWNPEASSRVMILHLPRMRLVVDLLPEG